MVNDMKPISAGLKKQAFGGVGTALASALSGHVGTNLAGVASHGINSAEQLAHKGLQHGLGGAKMNPFARLSTRLLGGAEALTSYDAAHALAAKIQHLPTAQQRAILAGANIPGRAGISADTPVLGALQSAIQHELAGTSPELMRKAPIRSGLAGVWDRTKEMVGRGQHGFLDKMTNLTDTQFDTAGKRVVTGLAGAAPAAAVAALDPLGAAGHYAVNAGRMIGAETNWGKNLALGQVQKGLRGEELSPTVRALQQTFISPGFTEAQDIGSSVRKNLGANIGEYGTRMADRAGAAQLDAGRLGGLSAGQKYDMGKHIVAGSPLPEATAKAVAPPPPPPPKQKGSGFSLLPAGLMAGGMMASQATPEPKMASYWRMAQKLADGSAHVHEEYEPRGLFDSVGYRRALPTRGASPISAALVLGVLASRYNQGGL